MALPIQPQNYGIVEEKIFSFSFRNEGGIRIPKAEREIAYWQSVDVIITSVDFALFENFKCNPPIQFYGYVILVFQDCTSLEIPLKFPRQRVYEFPNWEALRQWNELATFWEHWQYYRRIELEIESIKSALEIPSTVQYSDDFGDTKFKESPLSEVFVKVQTNAQFTIEYSQWSPVSFVDPLGNTRNGKSNQTPSDKDGGLPSEGIQARKNDPSNPFGGNPPPTPPSAESGFFVDRNKLTEVSSDNLPENVPATSNTEGYYFEFSSLAYGNDSGRPFAVFERGGCVADSQLVVSNVGGVVSQNADVCQGTFRFRSHTFTVTNTSFSLLLNVPLGSESFGFNVRYGLLPPSLATQLSTCLVGN